MTPPALTAVANVAELSRWGDDDDVGELRCCGVQDVTHDVKTFIFESVDGGAFHFDPGQFITLLLEIDGTQLERSYTISSPPTRPHRLTITVKRKVGGLVSGWLHDNATIGTKLRARAPLGLFSNVHHPATKYLFLSAGSGITPLMSMTRTFVDLGSDVDVTFVHSARAPSDIIFRSEQSGFPVVSPSIRVIDICARHDTFDAWTGLTGALDREMLVEIAPDLLDREIFVCGPAGYMAAVRQILVDLAFDMAHHHEETYDFAALSRAPLEPDTPERDVPGEQDVREFTISLARSDRSFLCGPDETILSAALRAGISMPSSCSQGMCGSCKVMKLGGEVDMQHNGGIRPREVAAGKILACSSRPLVDVSLDA